MQKFPFIYLITILSLLSCSKNDTNTKTSDYPIVYKFKSVTVGTTELYRRIDFSNYVKLDIPLRSKSFDQDILNGVTADSVFPYKQIQLESDKLYTVIFKDGHISSNNSYVIKNGTEFYDAANGYLASIENDRSKMHVCYPYSSESSGSTPIFRDLFQGDGCATTNKTDVIDFLVSSNLDIGDTLAINFPDFIFAP